MRVVTNQINKVRILLLVVLPSMFAFPGCATEASPRSLKVQTDFEGGSAEVLEIDRENQQIRIKPGGDPERGWPCWWYVAVEGVRPGKKLTVRVDAGNLRKADGSRLNPDWALPAGVAYRSNGQNWSRIPAERTGKVATVTVRPEVQSVEIAWGPPFVPSDARELVRDVAEHSDDARQFTLATSKEDRDVPALRVRAGDRPAKRRPVVWVQARQHAWESGSSWIAAGFTKWLTSSDPAAKHLRRRAEVIIVPIMDVDNAATGDGGKAQLPYDHNRDWSDDPVFPAVRAAQKRIRSYDRAKRMSVFIDLHNPDPGSKNAFFFFPPKDTLTETTRKRYQQFRTICRKNINDPIPLKKQVRRTGPNYDPRWKFMSHQWVVRNTREEVVGVTLETPWNTRRSTIEGYQSVGKQLARSVYKYLRKVEGN